MVIYIICSINQYLPLYTGPNRVTLQKLIRRYSLTDKQLNREIVDSDIPVMALNFDDVEMYSTAMGLAIAKQAGVKESHGNQVTMIKCLQDWKERDPFQATYRALLDIALRLGKGDTADKICQQLTQRKYMCISAPPPFPPYSKKQLIMSI